MSHKKVQCSECGKPVNMSHAHYYRNLLNYKVSNNKQLNSVYICRSCRCTINKTIRWPINRLPKYIKMLNELRAITNQYQSDGPIREADRNNFAQNINGFLKHEKINGENFTALMANNIITSFRLINIPVVGSITFPLKEGKYKKYE